MTDQDCIPTPVFSTDRDGHLLYVNKSFLELLGGEQGHWLQQPMTGFLPAPSQIFLQTHVWPMLLRDGRVAEIMLNVLDQSRRILPVLVNCRVAESSGAPTYHWVMFVSHQRTRYESELLEARRRAQALAQDFATSERFLRTVTDNVPGIIGYWDRDLRCQFANNQYLVWFGKRPEEMLGQTFRDALGVQLFEMNSSHFEAVLAGTPQTFERQIVKPDASVGHLLVHLVPDLSSSGEVVGFYSIGTNITELHEREVLVQRTALEDGLTGLPNRRMMMDRLAQAVGLVQRESKKLALLFLDLDGFKAVNDTFGHDAGDIVLKVTAARLLDLVRSTDTVARFGGDEFVVLLYSPESLETVREIANRIIRSINQPIDADKGIAKVGTSVGIAMYPLDGRTPEALLARADQAMYEAKHAGKNQYFFANSAGA